jgi:two-component system sensor histidine kinase SenX3
MPCFGDRPDVIAVAVIAVVLVAGAIVVSVLTTRRSVRHRIDLAVTRLGGRHDNDSRSLEGALARLDQAVDHAALRVDAALDDVARSTWALEAIPQGIVIWDEAGVEAYRNGIATAFTGARHAEVLVEQAIREALALAMAGSPQRRNLDILGPPRRILEISTVPLDDGARSTGALAVIEDVSERRRLEAVRRDFVANISHELKTPVGALGVLAETIASETDTRVIRRLAGRMTGESMRVGRIVDDLLALSRIEAEEQPTRESVGVRDLVHEAVDRIRSLAETAGITLDLSAVGRRHTVRGDRRQLVSAVTNLLENACKYSDGGSTVSVSSTADGSSVSIAVRDEGIGIPTTDLERVFERFYRVDRARSRETGGTGLGLAIVRHVANNHRGDVRVESREGVGSTFTLRLPAGPGPVAVSDVDDHREAEPA